MSSADRAPKPTAPRPWSYSRGWRQFSRAILHPGLRLLIRFRWQGKENIPKTGGIILAPNHMSYADWSTIALFSDGYAHRYPVFMIKSGIFGVPVIGSLMYKFGQLPVYRGRGDAGLVLKEAAKALSQGACVIVYPEGTATRDPDLWPMVAKTGVARLALTTGAPVIPVGQWGAQHILPYGSKKPKLFPRKTVRMKAGPPVDLSAYAGQRLGASTLRAATADIMADITALLAEIRQETPPDAVWDPAVGARVPLAGTGGDPALAAPASPASASPAAASPAPADPAAASPAPAGDGEQRPATEPAPGSASGPA